MCENKGILADNVTTQLFAINASYGKGTITKVKFVTDDTGYVLRIMQYGFDTRQFRIDTTNTLHFLGRKRKI